MNKVIPIFPLGEMVMFPGVVTEFYIFEPRYIDMIEHCLDSQGIFCFGTLVGNWRELYNESPEIFSHGCLCSIEEYQKHDDGRYSILVKGLHRVKISEIPSERLYRIVQTEQLDYIDDITDSADQYETIRNFIKRVLGKHIPNKNNDDLDQMIDDMELGKLLAFLCFQSPLDIECKLSLIKENSLKEIFMQLISQTNEN
ncbi:MAG: LON peptidase substrate-binding domain-containing protein [Lentisphaerales bacterium]|nr:LON peptidase substrate-binding domain-containing protein [Lentisphaerales bacterium]